MIFLSETRNGKIIAGGTGKITSAPQFRTFDSGNTLTFFFINSDTIGKGKEKQYESYKVNAWGEWSDYANALEKGDIIYLEGECKKDEYLSKKSGEEEYTINVQILYIANIGVEAMRLRLLLDDIRSKLASTPNAEKKKQTNAIMPNEQIDASGFTDIDPNDMPWEQGDNYEPSI